MAERSTKPYLIRAIHEWCVDSGLTPYLSVKVDENTRVPVDYVKNGEIVLNLSYDATHKLTITNDLIQFSARFSGVSRECSIPMAAVAGIFARENGQGMFFAPEQTVVTAGVGNGTNNGAAKPQAATATGDREPTPPTPPSSTRPKLQIVK